MNYKNNVLILCDVSCYQETASSWIFSICDIGSPRYGPRPERAKVERISGDVMSNGAFAESDGSLLLQHW